MERRACRIWGAGHYELLIQQSHRSQNSRFSIFPMQQRVSASRTSAPSCTLPYPGTTDLGSSVPVRPVRTRNSMSPINFSARHAPGFRPDIRDNFGRDSQSGWTPGNRLGFFAFLQQKRWDTVTHNPLVPGSSPRGPTFPNEFIALDIEARGSESLDTSIVECRLWPVGLARCAFSEHHMVIICSE
jgi:hypothetical protein